MNFKKTRTLELVKKSGRGSRDCSAGTRDDSRSSYTEDSSLQLLFRLHREMDRLFDDAFRWFGKLPFKSEMFSHLTTTGLLNPRLST